MHVVNDEKLRARLNLLRLAEVILQALGSIFTGNLKKGTSYIIGVNQLDQNA